MCENECTISIFESLHSFYYIFWLFFLWFEPNGQPWVGCVCVCVDVFIFACASLITNEFSMWSMPICILTHTHTQTKVLMSHENIVNVTFAFSHIDHSFTCPNSIETHEPKNYENKLHAGLNTGVVVCVCANCSAAYVFVDNVGC